MYKFIILSIFALIAAPASAFSPSMARNSVATVSSTTRVFALDDKKPLDLIGEGSPASTSEEDIQAALSEFKQQSQIKAFAVLGVAFAGFVYLKLQYVADPSHFIGSH
mmetsp:Transcript_2372/g.3652  ORF Transcript_2372/g.3652 Transcript_2372/m.3652 type:complete len:108 (+) Transcript_2372:112-435(+)